MLACMLLSGIASKGGLKHLHVNFDNIQDRDADREPFVIAADKIIRRKTRLAAANDAGLGGRATHVECDRSFEVKHLAKRHRPDDPAGGPRFHKLDTLAPRHFDIRETAVGLHNHQATCETFAPQAPLEVVQVVIHLGADVGVRRHRRGALVFPVLPRELMRSADEEIRIGFAENLAHADLMLRSAIRM